MAQLDAGTVVITSPAQPAAIGYDPPNDRVEYASEGAATAVRRVLDTPNLGHPQLEAALGVIEFAFVPFAAGYGAITASQQRVPPDKLLEVEQELARAMRSSAGSEVLREKVFEAARQKTCRLLICAPSPSVLSTSQVPVSAVLEIAVEQLRLKAAKLGQSEFILCVDARARLLRTADRAVLVDRPYQYRSGPALFVDWAGNQALAGVARTAYQSLAEQIACDIFEPSSEPPLLIGPGQKHSCLRIAPGAVRGRVPARITSAFYASTSDQGHRGLYSGGRPCGSWLPARERFPRDASGFRLVSSLGGGVMSLEVYTAQTEQHLYDHMPGPKPEGGTAAQTDAQWALDGLEDDRNSVVQAVACLAAVPIGLWEQTLGALVQHSRGKADSIVQSLESIPDESRYESALADEVAQHLRSQVVNPVRRAEGPSGSLAIPSEWRAVGPVTPDGFADRQLALRIQVVIAKLVGKHRSSRSRALCVETRATVIRPSDGQELYSRPILYRSSARNLKDWAASDAKLLRQDLDACARETAQAGTGELIRRGYLIQGIRPSLPNRL